MSRSPGLTATYAALALAALVLCWSNNLQFFGARRSAAEAAGRNYSIAKDFGEGFAAFFLEAFNTKVSSCITTELLVAVSAFAVQFKVDGARFGVLLPFLWLLLSYLVAISVTVPLFFAACHGARARRFSHRSELPASSFPFLSTLLFLCLSTASSVAQYYVATGPVGGDPLALFQKLMSAAFVLTLPYMLSPLSIGSSRPHTVSASSVPRIQFLYGLCAGMAVVLLTVARLPLLAQALTDTGSLDSFLQALVRDAFSLPAIRSLTWDYLLLLASFTVHVLAEGPFSFTARLAWALFAVTLFPIAVPMYLMAELSRDPAKVKTA